MSSFWKRNRRKLVAAAAVGAAGAAAAYYWWTYESEDQAEERRRRDATLAELQSIVQGDRRRGPSIDGPDGQHQQQRDGEQQQHGGGGGGGEGSLDDSLQAHFQSIQVLSERQALEDLLPRLRGVLNAATDYGPIRERLRAQGLAPEEKRALWAQLAGLSFARAMGAVWLVPLLDLLVRLKLHVVARHMYLEVQLPGIAPRRASAASGRLSGFGGLGRGLSLGPGRGPMPPRLSDRAKEEFFRSDFFIDVGVAGLLHRLRRACDAVLSAVDLAGAVGPGDVERLVVAVHARFEAEFQRGGDVWAAYLVPPGGQPVALHTPSGIESFMSPVEATMVDELNTELREIAGDYRFAEALRAEVRHTSRIMGSYVTLKMAHGAAAPPSKGGGDGAGGSVAGAAAGGEQQQGQQQQEERDEEQQQEAAALGAPALVKPFPFVVPIVAKSSNLLFDEANRCTRGMSGLREVQSLCASVFTFGPHIQDGFSPLGTRR